MTRMSPFADSDTRADAAERALHSRMIAERASSDSHFVDFLLEDANSLPLPLPLLLLLLPPPDVNGNAVEASSANRTIPSAPGPADGNECE